MTIINEAGRIENLTYGEFFSVQLHNGDTPSIELNVSFNGMPIKMLTKLAYDTMKVKFRPHVKSMDTDTFTKTFNHQTITWREMITKEGASSKIAIAEKSPEEIHDEIARLKAILASTSTNVSTDAPDVPNVSVGSTTETSEDISSDNYIPPVS